MGNNPKSEECGVGTFLIAGHALHAKAWLKLLDVVLGQKNAGELTTLTGMSKANVSQHMNILKARGLVHCDKCGTFCHYRLTSPKVLETCEIVRELILDQMQITTRNQAVLSTVAPIRKARGS